jgi:YqaJ-like viral recombinase domain
MALTALQQSLRRFKITASMLPILMFGDKDAILKLYREEMGEIEREPPNYAMRLGSLLEPFILDYHQETTGRTITCRGNVIDHPTIPEFCCTLDGFDAKLDAVIESKFLGPWRRKEEFVPYYYPQVLAQMRCVGCSRGILLAGQGTSEPVEYEIDPKPDDPAAIRFEAALWDRVEAFRTCLRTFTPPFPMPRITPPEIWRVVDLTVDTPNWGQVMLDALHLFEETREAAETHAQAGKDARSLVPDDVSIVLAYEHRLARDKRGVISIKRKNS